MRSVKVKCCAIALIAVATSTQAGEWNQFRGGNGTGISTDKNFPVSWSQNNGILWKTPLIERANSSPAITSKWVVVTSQTKDTGLWVIILDRKTGKVVKQVQVGKGKLAAKGAENLWAFRHNAATPSPIADDNSIWAFFGTGLLVCVDAKSGEVKWEKNLVSDYGAYDITFGMGSSPRLHGDLLYVNCMTKGPSYVVAIDKNNGDEVWKVDRRLPADKDGPDAYSTPSILRNGNELELVIAGSDHVNAYHLKSGRQNWVIPGLKIKSPYGRVIAAPTGESNVVVATSSNPGGGGLGHVMAVQAGDNPKELWRYGTSTPDSSSPLVMDGRVYLAHDKGIATCLELKSGKVIWRKRLGGTHHASLVAGDGKVYYVSIEGVCTVIEAGDAGKVLAKNQLDGTFYATPALADGVLYLRAYERIYAIDGK